MSNSSDQVHLAPDGRVDVGEVGSTLPTNATMDLDAAFSELGYLDEDGASLTPGVDLTDIMAWQSTTPVKVTLDSVKFEVAFKMLQVNKTTWGLYFFNQEWTNNFGQAKLTLLSNPGSQEKAVVITWFDEEDQATRLVLPKATLADREALQLQRNQAQLTGVTFRALDYNGVVGYVYSEDPNLVPSS